MCMLCILKTAHEHHTRVHTSAHGHTWVLVGTRAMRLIGLVLCTSRRVRHEVGAPSLDVWVIGWKYFQPWTGRAGPQSPVSLRPICQSVCLALPRFPVLPCLAFPPCLLRSFCFAGLACCLLGLPCMPCLPGPPCLLCPVVSEMCPALLQPDKHCSKGARRR